MVRPARLAKPSGGTVDAVIGRLGEGYALLAVDTGATLGRSLPYAMFYEAGPYLVGDVLISSTGKDGSPAKGWGKCLAVDAQGQVTWTPRFEIGAGTGYPVGTKPFAASPAALIEPGRSTGIGDPLTGLRLAGLPARGDAAVIAGHYLVYVLEARTPPADLVYDRHLARHGLPIRPLYGTDHSVLAHFGCTNGGVYPHGRALYVQSATHLYCLAEP
jgi:hypothetical protein